MKIAICISGHLRTYKYTYKYFKNIFINDLTPDIFLSTWEETPAELNQALDMYKPKSHIFLDYKRYKPKLQEATAFVNKLTVKRAEVFKMERIYENNTFLEAYPGYRRLRMDTLDAPLSIAIASQFFQVQQALQLMVNYSKENNVTYDLVIRVRPDLLFFTIPKFYAVSTFKEFEALYNPAENKVQLQSMKPGELYTVANYQLNNFNYFLPNDYFYHGTQDTMSKLASIYDDYQDTMTYMKAAQIPVPLSRLNESIFHTFLKLKGITLTPSVEGSASTLYSRILRPDNTLI